tara:strand:+ start:17 stop:280 length:264 start_codon:yes stop_codon:yes gene_type:complete
MKNSTRSQLHNSDLSEPFEGCQSCNNTGFKGRIPVMSHLAIDKKNASLIEKNIADLQIVDTMYGEAQELFHNGLTSLSEVNRLKQNI